MFDLLVIDDSTAWQELVTEAFNGIYRCDVATTYETAIEKINAGNYRIICLNWAFHSIYNGKRLLTLLKEKHPDVSVVLITGAFVGGLSKVQSKYPNVKEILVKGSEPERQGESDFVSDLLDTIPRLIAFQRSSPTPVPSASDANQEGQGILSWLHLSDLHIGCKEKNRDWNALKKALLQDVQDHQTPESEQSKRCAGVIFRPDLIFITGDITYRAAPEEYKEAEKLLESIWEITGLGKERTFIVPGNHDVDRKVVENDPMHGAAYQELANQQSDGENWLSALYKWWGYQPLHGLWKEKFAQYLEFANRYTGTSTKLGYYIQPIQVSGIKLDIIGLNSTLMSWTDGEDIGHGLWIGKPQLDELENSLSKDAHLRITLVHHSREAFHCRDVAWERVQQISSMILHGHMHELRAVSMGEPEHEHIRLPGGSVHQDGIWRSQRYSYGQVDLTNRKLDLYLRMTKPGEYPVYIRDIQTYPNAGADGHIQIGLNKLGEKVQPGCRS